MKKIIITIAFFYLLQLCGCLGVYKLEKPIIHYQLSPDVVTVPCSAEGGYVVKVMPVLVAPPYNGVRLMYSPGSYKVEPSVYYRWITTPGTMIREYIVKSLKDMPVFEEVVKREGVIRADYVLETRVSKLECMKTDGGHAGHLEANIVLIRKAAKVNLKPEICLRKSYKVLEEIPGEENPPDVNDVVASLNEALKKFVSLMERDLCDYFSSKK